MMKRYLLIHYFLISTLLSTLLLTTTVVVNGQSIQGYIYWDTNANGMLDGLNNDSNSNEKKSELENGIIDVTVQVHSCYSTTNNDNDDGKFSVMLSLYTLSFLIMYAPLINKNFLNKLQTSLNKTPTNQYIK